MAGDEVGGNNVMECDANNRNDVGISCTNTNNKNMCGSVCWVIMHEKQHSQFMDSTGGSEGRTPMVGGLHLCSLPATPCECAKLPVHISGGSRDGMPRLVLHSN